MKATIVCMVALLLVGGLVLTSQDDRAELDVDAIVDADLQNVFGGQLACWEDDTQACPATHFCEDACAGLAVGDACAESGYVRVNPNYRQAKASDEGKKDTKTISPAKICGNLLSCGPVCVALGAGVTCPTSSITDYELETIPDGDDCDEATAMLDSDKRRQRAWLLAVNGVGFDAFRHK